MPCAVPHTGVARVCVSAYRITQHHTSYPSIMDDDYAFLEAAVDGGGALPPPPDGAAAAAAQPDDAEQPDHKSRDREVGDKERSRRHRR